MIDRRKFVGVLAGLGIARAPMSSAQQATVRIPRIGFLGPTSEASFAARMHALRAGLRDLGYVEGRNIQIEGRWADGTYARLPALADELVKLKVDVILTPGTPPTLAAMKATTTIPIVMTLVGDAVGSGVVNSLARPGGNVTGTTFFLPELSAKRIELLKEAMPGLGQVAVLVHADNPSYAPVLRAMEQSAGTLKIGLRPMELRGLEEFDRVFATLAAIRADALVVTDDSTWAANAKVIAQRAEKQRLPTIGFAEFADAGGLYAYGVDRYAMFRRAAYFVDKILKGAKPGELPVELPTKFDLIVNMRTASAIGVSVPQSLLLRADRVIA